MKKPVKRPAKDFQTSLLLDPVVKDKAQAAAAKAGRSTSAELRFRIEQSFRDDEIFPSRHDPVIRAAGSVLEQVQREFGRKWYEDPDVGDVCRRKMIEVLELLLPTVSNPKHQTFTAELGSEHSDWLRLRYPEKYGAAHFEGEPEPPSE